MATKVTTFDEARAKALKGLEDAWIDYRTILSEPGLNNPGYGKLKDAREALDDQVKLLFRLNEVIDDAGR